MLMSIWISQFYPQLKDGVAKVAAKLGPDQQMSVRMSDFEPKLKVVAATVAGRFNTVAGRFNTRYRSEAVGLPEV